MNVIKENAVSSYRIDSFDDYLADLERGRFAFIDFGSSSGGSLVYCEEVFGLGEGIGIDKSERKLLEARHAGRLVVKGDLRKIDFPENCVKFCSAMDFLEHLPDQNFAEYVLSVMGKAAADFIFIRHPSFEDIQYLASFGLKLDWTDWKGHTNMMTLAAFEDVFKKFGWSDYRIVPRKRVEDSNHNAIVPITAPTDTVRYNPETCGTKSFVKFERECFEQFDILVKLNPELSDQEWEEIVAHSVK